MSKKNWAGNITFAATHCHTPSSLEALQEVISRTEKIRPVGTRHSFNRIADTPYEQVSLEKLNEVILLDRDVGTVTFEAGMRYGELCQYLATQGFAIHNLASLVHINVAGACATATHGSGINNGNLATAVAALELVQHDGNLLHLDRSDSQLFNAVVIGLGGLGVISKITLDIEPAFFVQQIVYENLPFSSISDHFVEIMGYAYSVSLFTDWAGDLVNQVWIKHKVENGMHRAFPDKLFGARPAPAKRHPVFGFPVECCTDQLGVPGPWHDRLQHFKLDFTPSAGEELQAEYLLPIENAVPALNAVRLLGDEIHPLLYTSEIRTVAGDDLWMSMNYKQPSVAIHFTWKPNWPAVKQCMGKIESLLVPLGARPHWGKLFTIPRAQVLEGYEMWPAFQRAMNRLDPDGKFGNDFLHTHHL